MLEKYLDLLAGSRYCLHRSRLETGLSGWWLTTDDGVYTDDDSDHRDDHPPDIHTWLLNINIMDHLKALCHLLLSSNQFKKQISNAVASFLSHPSSLYVSFKTLLSPENKTKITTVQNLQFYISRGRSQENLIFIKLAGLKNSRGNCGY